MTDAELIAELSCAPSVSGRPNDALALVIGGMGGSALAADAPAFLGIGKEVLVHRGYGLPRYAPKDALYIAVSYSGNTDETLSFAEAALKAGHPLAIVASGGELEKLAKARALPLASVPAGLAPRNAFMHLVRALLALIGEDRFLAALAAVRVDTEALHAAAREDALFFENGVPLFYASDRNALLARIGKLVMNETARLPAFMNTFPELNHNEMQSFDEDMPAELADLFRFMLIEDAADHPRVAKRMEVFGRLMEEEHHAVRILPLEGSRAEALASTWLRFLFAGRDLALAAEVNPDTAPLVEKFKKLL